MGRLIEQGLALKLQVQGVYSRDASRSIYAVASSVRARRPDLKPHAASDGSVTLMFSDLEGFTQVTERRGDGFLLAFASALQAVRWE